MLNLSTIVNLAQTLLPANSPWRERVTQAADLAKQFSPNKDGIAKLMAQYGKNRDDLQAAIKSLDNPIIKNTIGRVPGLDGMLRNAANNLANDPQFNSGAMPNPSGMAMDNPVQNVPPESFSSSSFAERLKRMP